MGIAEDGIAEDAATIEHASPPASPKPAAPANGPTIHPPEDPIWSIKREEVIRLLGVYEEGVEIIHPVVSVAKISRETNLYSFMESAHQTGYANKSFPGAGGLQDDNTILLKMILAIALVVEGSGQNDLGHALYLSVKPKIESGLWEPVDLKTVKFFALAVWFCPYVLAALG